MLKKYIMNTESVASIGVGHIIFFCSLYQISQEATSSTRRQSDIVHTSERGHQRPGRLGVAWPGIIHVIGSGGRQH